MTDSPFSGLPDSRPVAGGHDSASVGDGGRRAGNARFPVFGHMRACRVSAPTARPGASGGQAGGTDGRGRALPAVFRKPGARRASRPSLRIVSATAGPRALTGPIAKRRSRVVLSSPWPVRMRLRSPLRLQPGMW